MKTVGIIGAGASGMMAAITAARAGAAVLLIEHRPQIGKKILSTGNGRCNFTNTFQDPSCYRSDNPDFAKTILSQFTSQDAIAFFLKLGIYSKNRNGYIYPYSDQASAVLEVLQQELERLQVTILTETETRSVSCGKKGFSIQTGHEILHCDRLILAAGGKAASVTGSDGSGYDLAKQLDHHLVPVLPSLVQLHCAETCYKQLAGIRVQGSVAILVDGIIQGQDTGEIQLTKYGISGIPVFQVSRFAARGLYERKKVEAVLDFMPDFSDEGLTAFLGVRIKNQPEKTMKHFFTGLYHPKLAGTFLRLCRIPETKRACELTGVEIASLTEKIKHFCTVITKTNPFENAQVCAGGVDTVEINAETMESNIVPGLFFAGELVDVDGICGGYNLQWAWSSGYVAGREAAK
ncbi:BaiN/RdsA family NAD(P)/FAD-dependent oxidoreductase [Hespellia stercorisuis]|uniref:Aminoacetone oxidase family FAD-binding enzyme n=1 Tax=Hespellia stercorisuis DSM 15480 TaxID=1121950 RepID=A0A1M6N3S1_9FIRM|nr:NAD(P)/FAD-dependent oxidoreductase [Hespellia stercorisuis]SHJ90401.1 hypothetical protein SAMN02745243_01704 [Hespellia stercorisuis DSM 15480]